MTVSRPPRATSYREAPIAVIGMAGQVSGCADLGEFWELLADGRDAVGDVPGDRAELAGWPDEVPRRAGFLADVAGFDAAFFGISPREAESMDPQQRLMLETVWRAIEDAGARRENLRSVHTSVWMGGLWHDYELVRRNAGLPATQHSIVANSLDVLSARVSYVLGLRGPSLTVESSCSSSLVALHLACQSLARGESDVAIVGGANLILTPETSEGLHRFGGLSPTGLCRPFSASADGFARGEGVLAVVLKPLTDAVRDGDTVRALIVASGVNNDGGGDSLVTPHQAAQAELLADVYSAAAIAPEQVIYVEAHGTGTRRGDPSEAGAIGEVLGRPHGTALACGSVKSNIGHLEPAAGLAGLCKVVLAIENRLLPASLHAEVLNPDIDFTGLGIEVVREPRALPEQVDGFFGVNSFGWGGTNAHVVLAAPPAASASPPAVSSFAGAGFGKDHGFDGDGLPPVFTLSARSEEALAELVEDTADLLDTCAGPSEALLLARSWARDREAFGNRLAAVSAEPLSPTAVSADLRSATVVGDAAPELLARLGTILVRGRPRPVGLQAWVFPGQGSQWAGMAASLYGRVPSFTRTLDECCEALRPYLDTDLEPLLFGAPHRGADPVDVIQPALWAMSVALASTWRDSGLVPDVVVGHSQGEIAAATVAGILDIAEGARVVARRSRLLRIVAGLGRMMVVDLEPDAAVSALNGFEDLVTVAAVNGPRSCVLSGETDAILLLKEILEAEGTFCRFVDVDYASHSPQIDTIAPQVVEALTDITPLPGSVAFYSTVEAKIVDGRHLDGAYWGRNLRAPVRFRDVVAALIEDGLTHVVEVSPHPALGHSLSQIAASASRELDVLPTLRRGLGAPQHLASALACAWTAGLPIRFDTTAARLPSTRRTVRAPGHPLRHRRFWVEHTGMPRGDAQSLQNVRTDVAGMRRAAIALGADAFPWLRDHRIGGAVVLPAGFSLALLFGVMPPGHARAARDVDLPEPLLLDSERLTGYVTTRELLDGDLAVTIESATESADAMTAARPPIHLVARVHPVIQGLTAGSDGVEVAAEDWVDVDTDQFYAECATRGLDYGPAFRCLAGLRRCPGAAVATIAVPEGLGAFPALVHPVLWDAILQVAVAADPAGPVLPANIAEVSLVGDVGQPSPKDMWTVTARRTVEPRPACFDVEVCDAYGGVRALLRGVRFASLSGRVHVAPGTWSTTFVALDSGTDGTQDTAQLVVGEGSSEVLVLAAADADLAVAVRVADILGARIAPIAGPWPPSVGRVVLLSHGFGSDPEEASTAATSAALGSVHEVLRRLASVDRALALDVVTVRGLPGDVEVDPVAASVHGLLAVARTEYPQLALRAVDVNADQTDGLEGLAVAVAATCGPSPTAEDEDVLSVRGEGLYAARHVTGPPAPGAPVTRIGDGLYPFAIVAAESRQLAALGARYRPVRPPGVGEVVIRVAAGALNFIDVLKALGAYPDLADQDATILGLECAGTVAAVGVGVDDLQVGDRVVGCAPGALGSHATVERRFVRAVPDGLDLDAAAALPMVSMTAHYALVDLARVSSGATVLIHSAAGGVGLAAVRLAQRLGAEVVASAGTEEKRQFLADLGVRQVIDSRASTWAADVLAAYPCGVDVVLNSLTGRGLGLGLEVLAVGGHLVEIGKLDIHGGAALALAPFAKAVSFSAVDIAGLRRTRPDRFERLLDDVWSGVAADVTTGCYDPLPFRSYPFAEAGAAFERLASGRHVGKVVLVDPASVTTSVHPRPIEGDQPFAADGTVILTGGGGGLGLSLARALVEGGARSLALLGRAVNETHAIDELRGVGARIQVLRCDVADEGQLASALDQIRAERPIIGVVHAAGVLEDATLDTLTQDVIERVVRPKAAGAELLDRLTRHDPVELFVLFSSAAAFVGSPGQGAYAAANAYLDGVARRRRTQGLPALSVQWGPVSDVGLAATSGRSDRLEERGLGAVHSAECWPALFEALIRGDDVVSFSRLDPARWAQSYPATASRPLWRSLLDDPAGHRAVRAGDADLRRLNSSDRRARIGQIVHATAARILRLPSEELPVDAGLKGLGLDSLMSLEMRAALENAVGVPLAATLLWRHTTVTDLAEALAGLLGATEELPGTTAAVSAS